MRSPDFAAAGCGSEKMGRIIQDFASDRIDG
jgi:hypothetical protein